MIKLNMGKFEKFTFQVNFSTYIWILALFLIIPDTLAYIDCTPSACSLGYTDNGLVCSGSECVRSCTRVICGSAWTQVHSATFGWDLTADIKKSSSSSSYIPASDAYCYNFSYKGPSATEPEIRMWSDTNPNFDCDGEMVGGFRQGSGQSNPWFSGMDNYIGAKTNTDAEFMLKIVRAHAEEDSDQAYINNAAKSGSIYCAPNTYACGLLVGTESIAVCDTDCYNQPTNGRVVQGYYKDKGSEDQTLYDGAGCGGYVIANEMKYSSFKVFETPVTLRHDDNTCDRIHEAPSASNVKVLPVIPNAGEDLLCNYTYSDPERFTEQNSTYEWWKNGINQNINSQILNKNNLTPGDQWDCKVSPSDGLLFGTQAQNTNTATIRNTVKNPNLYIGSTPSWNNTGYFGNEKIISDFNHELNDALSNCSEDSEGFCNISLVFSSGNFGLLNLSDFQAYYLQRNASVPVSLKIDSLATVYTHSTLRIFEFTILNNGQAAVSNIQWQIDTNDGNVINGTLNINSLAPNEKAFVYVPYNFSTTGSYNVKANATGLSQSTALASSLSSDVGIGDLAISFANSDLNANKAIFEIQAKNNLQVSLTNLNWSIATGDGQAVDSASPFASMRPNETVFIFADYEYGKGGTYNPIAFVTSNTYSDLKGIILSVKHIQAYNLSLLSQSINGSIFEFAIKNSLKSNLTNVSWTLDTKNGYVINSTITSLLQPSEIILLYAAYNFTSPGEYNVNGTAVNGSLSDYRNLTVVAI